MLNCVVTIMRYCGWAAKREKFSNTIGRKKKSNVFYTCAPELCEISISMKNNADFFLQINFILFT